MRRLVSRITRQQDASIAVMAALCMVMFAGCLGLVLDAGVLYVQRTQLQKAADAAALAGAYDIALNSNSAADATLYAKKNQLDPSADANTTLPTNKTGTTFAAGDSWTVTAQRKVAMSFAPLVGFSNGTVKASATAIKSPAKSMDASYLLPYAVWDGNQGSPIHSGEKVTYRGNSWIDDNVQPDPGSNPPSNQYWNVSGNNFKGYFNQLQGTISQNGTISSGGNSSGTEPLAAICDLAAKGLPGIMPIVKRADSNSSSNITFVVEGFVGVIPDAIPACNGSVTMSIRFRGTLMSRTTYQATPGGSAIPGEPAVYVLKLWY
jgi:Flp pilus assembly protein TadG